MDNSLLSYIALIGTSFLIICSKFPTKSRLKPAVAIIILTTSFLLCIICIKPVLNSLGYVDNTDSERLIAHNLTQLRQDSGSVTNIIIIEGGSYPNRGLNGQLLHEILTSKGYTAKILQFTMAGANHFERFHILNRFFSELSEKETEKIATSNLVLMSEVQLGYDSNPLSVFEKNRFNNRTYAYLSPLNTWAAWNALSENKIHTSRNTYFGDLFSNAITNFFNIGIIHRVARSTMLKPLGGFQPLEKSNETYKFTGLEERAAFFEKNQVLSPPKYHWLESYRKNHLLPVFGSVLDHFIFFSVTSVHSTYQQYAHSFCENVKSQMCIDAITPTLLRALNHSDLWYDGGHLSRKGSEIYTPWLADSLIESGVLVK